MLQEGLPHELFCQQGALMLQCQQEANACLSIQSTCLCQKDNQCKGNNGSNKSESKWSSLPDLILCLIKDKLDVVDDIRVSAVCRGWLSASRFYPNKFSGGDGFPWIMQQTLNLKKREFISVTRKKKFTLDMPDFCAASVISSRGKWFLMARHYPSPKDGNVYLLNPFAKDKIKLPYIDPSGYLGSFSTSEEGYPRLVVLLTRHSKKVTIRTAYVGDALWTEQSSYELRLRRFRQIQTVLVIGEYVYCYDLYGQMFVYNMSTHVWKEVPGSESMFSSMMEFEGELVRVCQRSDNYEELSFFKYNDAETSWQPLELDVVKDLSWFISTKWCFCARTKHQSKAYSVFDTKICSFKMRNNPSDICKYSRELREIVRHGGGPDIVVDNLVDGNRSILDVPYRISTCARWVDLG